MGGDVGGLLAAELIRVRWHAMSAVPPNLQSTRPAERLTQQAVSLITGALASVLPCLHRRRRCRRSRCRSRC